MNRLVALIVAVTAGAVAASPAYPVRWKKLTAAEVAERVAAFHARNPEHWTGLGIDDYGHFTGGKTDDPTLLAGDISVLRDFVRRNADVMGVDPAIADQLARNGDAIRWDDVVDGVVRGQILFIRSAKERWVQVIYFIPVQPTHGADEATNWLVGKHYDEVVSYGYAAQLDCGMTPAGPAGCKNTVVGKTKRELVITAQDVHVQTQLTRDGDAIRLVRCAEIAAKPAPRDPSIDGSASVFGIEYVAKARAPAVPLVLDAVTGEILAPTAPTCNALRNVR